ncbi:MAG TPA: hypothetical protein DCO79_02895 [Spirochaeta sp.]|nr:hypothetical protein [Spirochaeta sp.]
MKKLLLTAVLILITVASICAQADEAAAAADFTDETKIILTDTAEGEVVAEESGQFFTTWDFIKVILILIAVILVIYAIFYAIKRTGGLKYQNDELIKLLGSQSLTQNGSVHLIEVGAKYYLVGCGDGSVSHIADVDDKETIDEIMLKKPATEDGRKSFADIFNLRFGRKDSSSTDLKDRIGNNTKIMHDQAERLKKM